MNKQLRYAVVSAVLSLAAVPAFAQDAKKAPMQAGETARPANAAANKPSESGAQTDMRSGAVTGAGQPQGAAQPAQAQSADSAKAKSATGAKAKKPAKKKKARKARVAKDTADTSGATAQGAR